LGYVDGTLMPVPVANKEAFRAWAATMAALFREHGATRVLDGWGDDVPDGKVTDFKRAVKAKDGETVMYGWVEWPSKDVRDMAWGKMMADPRMQPNKDQAAAVRRPAHGLRRLHADRRRLGAAPSSGWRM
jgi:uncharacterized protein YbaA (DUF1428 family)